MAQAPAISQTLLERLANAQSVVVFSGAGISAESGVATFRTKDGLWSKFKPEELANMQAFLANPQMVWEWYQARREMMAHAAPNPGHYAIAQLEQLVPRVSVVTQNIDGLHREARSTEVLELHGNIRKNFCQRCKARYDDEQLMAEPHVQRCHCGGLIRPDVVWFGEMLPEDVFALAEQRARQASVLFSVGTSSVVYPAAGIPLLALEHGAYVVEINPEATPFSSYAHEALRAPSGIALPEIVQQLKVLRYCGMMQQNSPRINDNCSGFVIAASFALLLCLLVTFFSGCSTGTPETDSANRREVVVLAAASLKDAFTEIGKELEATDSSVTIKFSFAGSNLLMRQIEQGAPADVFASAAESLMDTLQATGAVAAASRVTFARNRLVVISPATATDSIHSLGDILTVNFIHIAVASPGVPARIYAEEALRNAELWERLQTRFVYGANVRQTLDYVAQREADCGFVYATDAATMPNRVRVSLVVDTTLYSPISYPAAQIKNAPNPDGGSAFLKFLASPPAQAILKRYGFIAG